MNIKMKTTNNFNLSLLGSVLLAAFIFTSVDAAPLTVTKTFAAPEVLNDFDLNNSFDEVEAAVNDNDGSIGINTTAIADHETRISAGSIATVTLAFSNTLISTFSDVLSIAITAPAAGFVHVSATGVIQLNGKTNTSSGDFASVRVGVTNLAASTPDTFNSIRFFRNGVDGAGSYEIPYSVQGVFGVGVGSNTFFISALENGGSGSGRIFQNQLTVTFHAAQM